MRLLTGSEMEEAERWAARRQGLSAETLMERAGEAVADRAAEIAPAGPIAIIAGKGNNGGDGRVAANLLTQRGVPVRLVDLADASVQADVDAALAAALEGAALAVDAVFGFSLHGPPRAPYDRAIRAMERAAAAGMAVLAVDVPSGVEAHSGHTHGVAVRATETLTMTAPKLGLMLEPGRSHAGQVTVADLGIDPKALKGAGGAYSPEPAELARLLPQRPRDSHKKQCGRVLVVAGSQGMTGAACLTAAAALRSGAGMVHVAVPASLTGVVEAKLTETITVPLPETFSRSIDETALDIILDMLPDVDVLALGPGLSLDASTVALVHALVPEAGVPLVLDADGLNAMIGFADDMAARKHPTVITPHPGELARLAGATTADVQHDRPGFARGAARDWRAVTVLKGAPTLTTAGAEIAVNPTGNPGMATAGSGDVLTGLVAGLVAQGMSPLDAAVLSAWIQGRAGDVASERLTEYCLVAGDILECVPVAFGELVAERAGTRTRGA